MPIIAQLISLVAVVVVVVAQVKKTSSGINETHLKPVFLSYEN